jgi:3',5'-cyclic-nucleotide phosphodiesterase
MVFDITVLGSSGGPLEGGTCAYLIKPTNISFEQILADKLDDAVLAVDFGSGLSRMCEIISSERYGDEDRVTMSALRNYNETLTIAGFTASGVSHTAKLGLQRVKGSPIQIAAQLQSLVKACLLTHPHIDHLSALVVNSASFGSASGKKIYGLEPTCQALEQYIFNDRIWPDLTSEDNGTFLSINRLQHTVPMQVNDIYKITPFTVKHGCVSPSEVYHSTSFLLENTSINRFLLVFGDFEADSGTSDANSLIWNHVASYIVQGQLKTVIIECSTANVPATQPLYGHMTPKTLFGELIRLNEIIMKHGHSKGIRGLHILITHVKDQPKLLDPRKVVLRQLLQLNEHHGLGAKFTVLLPGQTYSVQ